MTWKTIDAKDAKPGDRVRIGDKTFEVESTDLDILGRANNIRIKHGHGMTWVSIFILNVFGATFEREVPAHSHGLVPDTDWVHIILGNGRHAVLNTRGGFRGLNWSLQDGRYDVRVDQKTIQSYADEYGFDVLWPKPEPIGNQDTLRQLEQLGELRQLEAAVLLGRAGVPVEVTRTAVENYAKFGEFSEPVEITDEMVELAAIAICQELGQSITTFKSYESAARAGLEAALGGDQE